MPQHRIVGINFDHAHMGQLLDMVKRHPNAEVVGVWHSDPQRAKEFLKRLELPEKLVYPDWRQCMEESKPTVAIACPSTATHGIWTQRLAEYGVDILIDKPFAATLAEADVMIAAVEKARCRLAINWLLTWYPSHRTAKRLVDEGLIGQVTEVHYYDGNCGPIEYLLRNKGLTPEQILQEKRNSWFYQKDQGGGSLLDYLGYGTTLGAWFDGGRKPIEVTCAVHQSHGIDVDEQSITIARYDSGLSKFETRWGTFTDPWDYQPQPKCGFVLCGTKGTISSYDYEPVVRVQTMEQPTIHEVPVDTLRPPFTDPVSYFLHCIENDKPVDGPLAPTISRIGQQIVETAVESARQKRTLPLIG